jgi:cytoplasmic iron level regulating protein YaaA (DUF328/UPF0246 family)
MLPTNQEILECGLDKAEFETTKGDTFENIILENFYDPIFTKDTFPFTKIYDLLNAYDPAIWERNQKFNVKVHSKTAKSAVFAFNGDVYTGLDAYTLKEEQLNALQNKLRILSGLYGILKPLDVILPYRLEMGTALQIDTHKNLVSFWKSKITAQLNSELKEGELLVNLASTEYFNAVDHKAIHSPIITPVFKDYKSGKLKVISFFAKKARGMMVRYLIEHNASTLEELKGFTFGGYTFSAAETSEEFSPVFVR